MSEWRPLYPIWDIILADPVTNYKKMDRIINFLKYLNGELEMYTMSKFIKQEFINSEGENNMLRIITKYAIGLRNTEVKLIDMQRENY